MSLPNNKLTIVVDNPICANGAVENSDASYTTTVVSGGTLVLPDSQINVNGVDEGDVVSVKTIDVNLEDSLGDPVTPTSVGLVGNTLTIEVASGGGSPSGVLFKTIEARQRTSYRTGDEGWRSQNGWFDYTPPSNPAAVAELDYTSANFFNVLANPLVVNGVSSTTRFVDVFGTQAFSGTGNSQLASIDKLTGYMLTRPNSLVTANWNGTIDFAESYSVVINGVTYDDWYLATESEYIEFYHQYAGIGAHLDTLTSVQIACAASNQWTSTTYANATTSAKYMQLAIRSILNEPKTTSLTGALLVRNARNLVTAP
jgi:hypothetical protein